MLARFALTKLTASACVRQFSTRASSIPIINAAILNPVPSKTCVVQHPYALDGYKAPGVVYTERDVFAVVDHSGKQFKLVEDDVIATDIMDGLELGQIVELDKILMVGSKNATIIGKPLIPEQKVIVKAVVEEQVKDKKVITLKFRRRKNSKNIRGFRRQLTILRVTEICLDADTKKDLGL